jgi:hypothetical protein
MPSLSRPELRTYVPNEGCCKPPAALPGLPWGWFEVLGPTERWDVGGNQSVLGTIFCEMPTVWARSLCASSHQSTSIPNVLGGRLTLQTTRQHLCAQRLFVIDNSRMMFFKSVLEGLVKIPCSRTQSSCKKDQVCKVASGFCSETICAVTSVLTSRVPPQNSLSKRVGERGREGCQLAIWRPLWGFMCFIRQTDLGQG